MTNKAYAVPLHELLAGVPRDTRLEITDPDGYGTRFIPVGRYCHEAAEALRAALAQLEPEPVAWGVDEGEGRCISLHDLYFVKADADHMAELKGTHAKVVPLYATPPQREFIGLTDEEIRNEANRHVFDESFFNGAIWARGQIKERNNG